MKTVATIFLTILTTLTFAQKIFTVDNFSKEYYGKIQISDTSEVFSKGWVAIYDRKTNDQIIKVTSDELALTLHDGKPFANIKSLPYGEQSLIMYDDFNFDGKKDLAICDGQNSSYHFKLSPCLHALALCLSRDTANIEPVTLSLQSVSSLLLLLCSIFIFLFSLQP